MANAHNHDSLSSNYNSEAVAVVRNPRVAQQFTGLMNRMGREGKTRSLDQVTLRRDSVTTKVKGFILNRVVGRML